MEHAQEIYLREVCWAQKQADTSPDESDKNKRTTIAHGIYCGNNVHPLYTVVMVHCG